MCFSWALWLVLVVKWSWNKTFSTVSWRQWQPTMGIWLMKVQSLTDDKLGGVFSIKQEYWLQHMMKDSCMEILTRNLVPIFFDGIHLIEIQYCGSVWNLSEIFCAVSVVESFRVVSLVFVESCAMGFTLVAYHIIGESYDTYQTYCTLHKYLWPNLGQTFKEKQLLR